MILKLRSILSAALPLTLPLVGVGVFHALTGKDLGGGLQPSWIVLALLMVLYCLDGKRPELSRLNRFQVISLGGVFLGLGLSSLGLLWHPSLEPAAVSWARFGRQILQISIMLCFMVWAACALGDPRKRQRFLDFFFLALLFQVGYGVLQGFSFFLSWTGFQILDGFFTSNPSILSGSEKLYLNNALQEIPRLRGTMCEPLYLGNLLIMAWPFLLVWKRPAWIIRSVALSLGILLLLTWSRGSWLALLAQAFLALLILLLRQEGRSLSRRKAMVSLVVIVAIVAVDHLTGAFLQQRLAATFNMADWSNLTRLYSMKAAWLAFLDSPLVGVGWGQFPFHFPLLVEPMGLQSQFSWPVVNNFPLKILAETGLSGFLIFGALGVFLVRKTFFQIQWKGPFKGQPALVMVSFLSVAGVWIQLLTFSQYNLPHIWVGLGLWLAALYGPESKEPSN